MALRTFAIINSDKINCNVTFYYRIKSIKTHQFMLRLKQETRE
jgi:hypothetical protein